MFAIIFICRNLFLWIAGKIANIAKIKTLKSFVPHSKSVHQSTTSELIGHTANSQSAILSVNESVNQQVSLSVLKSKKGFFSKGSIFWGGGEALLMELDLTNSWRKDLMQQLSALQFFYHRQDPYN